MYLTSVCANIMKPSVGLLKSLWSLLGFDQAFLHQAAVELLDVCVHTLPVRLFHPD